MDKLNKEAHFIHIKITHKYANIVGIFMKEIFQLHEISKAIIFDRYPKFTGIFWKSLFKGLDIKLNFNIDYHPQMNGQTERVNQVLEDMLQMYVRYYPKKLEDYLHLVEFAYNNHYQALAKLSPFEILYGRKCNAPVTWSNLVDRLMLGPDLLKYSETGAKQSKNCSGQTKKSCIP